jgi:hypothetical protein
MDIETTALPVEPHQNADLITGEPGSHPVATAAGSATACAAGAVLGSLAGPIGTAIGGVVGAIAGGLGGSAVGESIDPTVEDAHWRDTHPTQSYANGGHPYEKFIPGYRVGYQGFQLYGVNKRTFEEAETELREEYVAGSPELSWDFARGAARAAWERRQRIAAERETSVTHVGS